MGILTEIFNDVKLGLISIKDTIIEIIRSAFYDVWYIL